MNEVPTAVLTESEAAEYTKLSRGYLKKLRYSGRGPLYLKIGRRVLYPVPEMDVWMKANARVPALSAERR